MIHFHCFHKFCSYVYPLNSTNCVFLSVVAPKMQLMQRKKKLCQSLFSFTSKDHRHATSIRLLVHLSSEEGQEKTEVSKRATPNQQTFHPKMRWVHIRARAYSLLACGIVISIHHCKQANLRESERKKKHWFNLTEELLIVT